MLEIVDSMGIDFMSIKNYRSIARETELNVDKNCQSTIYYFNNQLRIVKRGNPIDLVSECNQYLNNKGEIKTLTQKQKETILKKTISLLEKQAVKQYAIIYKDLVVNSIKKENNGVLVCIIGLKDRSRKDVYESFRQI